MITNKDKKLLKAFGANLKRIRGQKNLSLREVSHMCSIDNSKISKIENGQINITLTSLFQLSNALDVSVKQLVDFDLL